MKYLAYFPFLISVALLISSCSTDESFTGGEHKFTATTDACDSISIIPLAQIDHTTDPFEIKDASVSLNTLVLEVAYGGGCGEVDFSLLVDNTFMESNPVQVGVIPVLQDHDKCKRYIIREICFDLTELSELYKAAYQTSSGSIIIHIFGHTSVLYTF